MEGQSIEIHAYLIAGMGSNKRLYEKMTLKDCVVHHLEWSSVPVCRSLAECAQHFAKQIHTENNVIIGSSMGGMVAVELAKIIMPRLTVLLSAPTTHLDFPKLLRNARKSGVYKPFGGKSMLRLSRIAKTFMGFKKKEQQAVFFEMLHDNGPDFLGWAIPAVLRWENETPPPGAYIQILGTADSLFNPSKIDCTHTIKDGGHFCTFEFPRELSSIINVELGKLKKE